MSAAHEWSNDQHNWVPVLIFDTDDVEFCRGVEVGLLYARLNREKGAVQQLVHVTNAEMMLRLAEARGRSVRTIFDDNEDWIEVEFGEASGEGEA